MQIDIDLALISFERLARAPEGVRVRYAGLLVGDLTLDLEPDATASEQAEARAYAASCVLRCIEVMSERERSNFLERVREQDPDAAERRSYKAFLVQLRDTRRRIEARVPATARPEVSDAERAVLATLGVDQDCDDQIPLSEALAMQEMLVATSVPLTDAAQALGVDPVALRKRLEDGHLLGVWLSGDYWRVLAFQMTSKGELPGLDMVLGVISKDISPVSIYAFFSSPQPRLILAGRMVSPIEWLIADGDPEAVAELARHV
ncbi:MAG: hypothetical protein ACU0E9_12060 [Limimaricola soesokkakensis]|uniref:hypothetical protein n=1 Tax=Limimaricola soesokkakensis TaxID=1343159 RepID=UPI004058D3AC